MRIDSISAEVIPPVLKFDAEGLSDLVVLAGPNGVGKTRLVTEILSSFRSQNPRVRMGIAPTNNDERTALGEGTSRDDPNWLSKVAPILHQNRRRRDFHSSVLYYESSRSIQNVQPLQFQWEFLDPFEEIIGWDMSLQGLGGRWTDTQHAIFKRIQSQKSSIAARAIQLKQAGHTSMNLQFDDPLDIFREVFVRLLGPKTLKRVDGQSQQIYYEYEGQEFPITTLSSGEREVVTICFDFLLRKPSDCIVFFDEPEVHLHPELLMRMVTALRSAGDRNQFIFITHSPDLISASLADTVLFLTPPKEDQSNQAINLSTSDDVTSVLHALGQSVGILSLGKKIVFIEGVESGIDKTTYQEILNNTYPQLVLVAAGGREGIDNFDQTVDSFLSKALWGIDFFMLTDRDVGPKSEALGSTRLRRLGRYHLENYFLEASVIVDAFSQMEAEGHWLRDQNAVDDQLLEIARSFLPYTVALEVSYELRLGVGNVSLMPSGLIGKSHDEIVDLFLSSAESEVSRVSSTLDPTVVKNLVTEKYAARLEDLESPDQRWKVSFPGKPILKAFCGKASLNLGRFKSLYINASRHNGFEAFGDIVEAFDHFASQ